MTGSMGNMRTRFWQRVAPKLIKVFLRRDTKLKLLHLREKNKKVPIQSIIKEGEQVENQ
jgi:ribosomal protein L39E